MPSFDIVSEVNQVEIRNAVDQANKEITNRFDFKGSDARVEINDKDKTLTAFGDDEFKLRQVRDVLTGKLSKRGVDIRALEPGKMEPITGNKMKETIKVREGIEQERAKGVVKLIRDTEPPCMLHRPRSPREPSRQRWPIPGGRLKSAGAP